MSIEFIGSSAATTSGPHRHSSETDSCPLWRPQYVLEAPIPYRRYASMYPYEPYIHGNGEFRNTDHIVSCIMK